MDDPFYSSKAWRKVRTVRMKMDLYQCQDCLDQFKSGLTDQVRQAVMVHHIVPYQIDPSKGLQIDNLVSLCDYHHERRHPEKRGKRAEVEQRPFRVIKIGG